MSGATRYILALDQGTTSSRAILFDRDGGIRATAQREFAQHFPQPGWVEHDADEIWQSQLGVVNQVIHDAGIDASTIAAIGITNQRETTVVWEHASQQAIHNAIVWQCRRTAPLCDKLKKEKFDKVIRRKTGLVTDAYFSGTKVAWLMDNVKDARKRALAGELVVRPVPQRQLAVFQMQDRADRAIEQIAVVGNDDDRMRVTGQILFQPQSPFEVEIVRRFIEEE